MLDTVLSQGIDKAMNDSFQILLPGVLVALQGQSNLVCSAVTSSDSTSVLHSASMAPSSLVS